jgi:type I restriction enzyme M protein
MLFVKYLSDVCTETKEKYMKQYDGDERRVERAMSRESFILDNDSTFDYLYSSRADSEIGQMINIALNNIEEHNSGKLRNVFRAIDFNSTVDFGEKKEKNATLKNVLEDFSSLDLRPSVLESNDIIGDAYEYMIANFASDAGKKGGEFFTPSQVSKLVATLVDPQENDRIYDPTCGSGGLLLKAYNQAHTNKVAIYGQEKNMQTWALCSMNMFLHGIDDAKIWQGDTLANPQNIEDDKLMKFQVVVANPPFSLDKWDSGFLPDTSEDKKISKMSAELDIYHRFDWGVPPSSKGDYAFVLHMLNSLDADNGRMGVVLPHGVLFRGASEGRIRQQIIEFNLLDAVIGLPANLFYGTSIPACVLLFKKNRKRRDVLFIDASGDGNFEKGKNQSILRDIDIEKIVSTYKSYETVDRYSYVATFDEIKENDFNLNIPRYVDTFEEEEMVDIDEVRSNIADIERELKEVQAQMDEYLKELGL